MFQAGNRGIATGWPAARHSAGQNQGCRRRRARGCGFQTSGGLANQLPGNLDLKENPLLRLNYVGDVARVTLNGRLLTDDFYNGNVFEVGLRRYCAGNFDRRFAR